MIGLIVSSLIIFVTLRLLPGDVAQVIAGSSGSPEKVAELREKLGLDQPLLVQYFDWMRSLATGDLGNSILTGSAVQSEILQKAEVTVPLTIYSLIIGLIIALPLGVLTAYYSRKKVSHLVSFMSIVAAAVPVVWAGLIAILIFSTWLGWFPSQGFPRSGWDDPFAAMRALTLPALTIGLIEGAILFRFVKSATYAALDSEYVRSAMSRGRTRFQSLIGHGLPSVGLSVVSILGLQAASLLVGAVIVEQLFSLPGLGRMLVVDVGNRDLIKVQSTLFVLTAVILILGALIDVAHRLIDPRMRVHES